AVEGEAGLGKSRLKHEVAAHARAIGMRVHQGASSSIGAMADFGIAALVRHGLDLADDASAAAAIARVEAVGTRTGRGRLARHAIADLVGARAEGSALGDLAPAEARRETLIAIARLFVGMAREVPRLLVLEDMHWADGGTREAVERLAAGTRATRCV